jgi:hypothetical protein
MRTLWAGLLTLVALAGAPVAAQAYEVHISITGAGQVVETTPANLVGDGCKTFSANPTGSVGVNCYPGEPDGEYGWGWDVDYVATAATGYRFVRWQSDGSPKPVICDRSSPAATTSTYTGAVCKFRTFDNLQTQAVFVDDTPPAMSTLSGPNGTVGGASTFTFSAASDPTWRYFECRVVRADGGAIHHDWQVCSSGRSEDPPHGTWRFDVRAVDWSGNRSSIATWQWNVDKLGPLTTITDGPGAVTRDATPTFAFTTSEAGEFTCEIAGVAATCTSPHTLDALADGDYTFEVWATDSFGNADTTPATYDFAVDTRGPSIAITTPRNGSFTNAASYTPGFTATDAHAIVSQQCRSDDGVFSSCADVIGPLADGPHTLTVQATDIAGNTSTRTSSFTVDTDVPETGIASGPPSLTRLRSATFSFTSDEPGTFRCRLDTGTTAPCFSGQTWDALADGTHTLRVWARDRAGNLDSTPAIRSWKVDGTAPNTTITSGPPPFTRSTSARVFFSSTEAGSTFRCRLDTEAVFTPCTSGQTWSGLAEGQHTLRVVARDAAGNQDATAAIRSWTVDLTPPDTTITGGTSGTTASTEATFTFTSTQANSTFTCRIDTGPTTTCSSGQTWSDVGPGPHTFRVWARDPAGNIDPTPATRTWTVSPAS